MKLYRCRFNRKILGVCGGLGHLFRVDPNVIRIICIFSCLATGIFPLALAYGIAAFVIPEGPLIYIEIPGKKLLRSSRNKVVSGLCAGIGNYFGINPALIRLGFFILTFVTFALPTIFTYIISSSIINEDRSR